MGTKYTTQSISGYNATPPADDGSTTAANQVFWSTIKTKLPDPIKTWVEAIEAALVTHLDQSVVDKNANYTITTAEHNKVVNCTNASDITLGDASTLGVGFIVTIKNSHTAVINVPRATGTDTIDGTAADDTIEAGGSKTYEVNTSANGFLNLSDKPTSASIRTLVEAATDSNVFTDADHSKLDGLAATVVTNHIRAGSTQLLGGSAGGEAMTATSSIVKDSWATVGPTGSTVVITALNSVPSTARMLIFDLDSSMTATTGTSPIGLLYAVNGDVSSPTPSSLQNIIKKIRTTSDSGDSATSRIETIDRIYIPCNASQQFKLYWSDSFSPFSLTFTLYYRGFVTD